VARHWNPCGCRRWCCLDSSAGMAMGGGIQAVIVNDMAMRLGACVVIVRVAAVIRVAQG